MMKRKQKESLENELSFFVVIGIFENLYKNIIEYIK